MSESQLSTRRSLRERLAATGRERRGNVAAGGAAAGRVYSAVVRHSGVDCARAAGRVAGAEVARAADQREPNELIQRLEQGRASPDSKRRSIWPTGCATGNLPNSGAIPRPRASWPEFSSGRSNRAATAGGMDDDEIRFRTYLARALGEFEVQEGMGALAEGGRDESRSARANRARRRSAGDCRAGVQSASDEAAAGA